MFDYDRLDPMTIAQKHKDFIMTVLFVIHLDFRS